VPNSEVLKLKNFIGVLVLVRMTEVAGMAGEFFGEPGERRGIFGDAVNVVIWADHCGATIITVEPAADDAVQFARRASPPSS
jgi:hypothetical protein